jgi:hypothetical protein
MGWGGASSRRVSGSLAGVDGHGEPRHQPIGMLATIALDELVASTIDRGLAKPDVQLGLEYLLGFGPPPVPRRPS